MSDSRWMWVEIGCTLVIPVAVMWFGPEMLGATPALMLGLAAPLLFLLANLRREGKISPMSALSIGSVLLTGALGLIDLDARWFAIKEAALPALMGLLLFASANTRFSVLPALLERVLDHQKLEASLAGDSARADYQRAQQSASKTLGLVIAASGLASFLLARALVTEPSGSEAFVTQLGSYTAWSFPAVALPQLLATGYVLQRALDAIERAAGRPLGELLKG